jgi:hypothetical protein
MDNPIECQITFTVSTDRPFILEEIERYTEEYGSFDDFFEPHDREWLISDVAALFTDESVYLEFIEDGPTEIIDSEEYLTFCVERVLEGRLY